MDNAIQGGTSYTGEEEEAIGGAIEKNRLDFDPEIKATNLIHWKHLGLICMNIH